MRFSTFNDTEELFYTMEHVDALEGPLSETLMEAWAPTVFHTRLLILLHKLGMR